MAVTINEADIVRRLKQSSLAVVNDVFGENLKAQTRDAQYIIYLDSSYLDSDTTALTMLVSELFPEFIVEKIMPMSFRRKGITTVEVWVFVRIKSTSV